MYNVVMRTHLIMKELNYWDLKLTLVFSKDGLHLNLRALYKLLFRNDRRSMIGCVRLARDFIVLVVKSRNPNFLIASVPT